MAARMHSLNQQCSSSSSSIAADHKHLAPNSCIRLQRAPAHFSLPLLHSRHATSALKATGGEEYTSGAVTSVAAALSVVVVPQAAAELYKALQPKRCQCCVGTGFVLCSSCQGRGKQGLTLPGEPVSHSACPVCLRQGRCQCTECDGSGLENWWLWQPASDPGWGPRGN